MAARVAAKLPIAVRCIELRRPLRALTDVANYGSVRLFVTWDDRPLGSVDIANHYQPIGEARLREAIAHNFAYDLLCMALPQHYLQIEDQTAEAQLAKLADDVSVSVVVATYDRPTDLRNCLRLLLAQESSRRIEIVVVDNNPSSGLTAPVLAEFPEVVLVQEPRKGLAYARNAGFAASSGDIAVATDDDVTMPPTWIEKLVAPFARSDVMVVTGNVLPLELETYAQYLFEAYGGLGRGFQRFEADRHWFASFRRQAVPTWQLGATANAAFRASIFSHPQIGLMDESLGPGMPSGVGEDTYLFYKVLKAGYTVVYEPAAYVWHRHRRDLEALRRQIYNYSKGHIAYHLTTLLRDGDTRALARLMRDIPRGYIWYIKEYLRGRSPYPLSMIWLEMTASLAGPWSLWRSRQRVRREGHSAAYVPVAQRSPIAYEMRGGLEG